MSDTGDDPGFAELVAASNFSFLRGASHPGDMVAGGIAHGYAAIGIADRNTVAGVVRAYAAHRRAAAEAAGHGLPLPRLLVGARLVFADGTPDIVAYPATRRGWGRLTRLLTRGNLRAVKGDCILHLGDLIAHLDDLLLIVLPASTGEAQTAHRAPVVAEGEGSEAPVDLAAWREERGMPTAAHVPAQAGTQGREGPPPNIVALGSRLRGSTEDDPDEGDTLSATLARLAARAPGRVWLGLSMPCRGDDARRAAALAEVAAAAGVPLIATNDALYATPAERPLHDVLTCIRRGTTIAAAGRALEANAERHLKPVSAMRRLFARYPQAIEETLRFAGRIDFTLDDLRYQYPSEPVPPGWEAQDWLEHLVWQTAIDRYDRMPDKVLALLIEEFALIRERAYAHYFLTVHDIVKFARAQDPPILCQGRGSAANSIVCFLLGITSVDPVQYDLLFSRFVSSERDEPPDIDVDFEHERREQVMQYIYDRYGRHRAGIVATVIHYRSRSAVREAAKVLGLGEDIATRLASTVWGSHSGDLDDRRYVDAGLALDNPEIVRLRGVTQRLLEAPFPRHLSQHVGGFILTEDRLDETVPIHHGAMPGRSFVEWDKDDIDALGLMKVDILALGMLTCIQKSFDLLRLHGLGDHDLEVDLAADDPAVFDMLCRGDSIGVFQVESRAQINMLPRLKPRTLYDLTVQVAIVRPGPIEGDMVHPYLRRRAGLEPVEYPSPRPPNDPDEIKGLLGHTFGVPLFQEQAMKLAIVAAGFTGNEANQLRRAMATFRNVGGMHNFQAKLIEGMVRRGYQRDFAERCYRQIEGFGSYGFPESHALSFARLVYVSSWIKCHHPAVFACALLNAQPMGFYAPAQIVRDAQQHGVEVRAIDVNHSDWDNSLEPRDDGTLALRLGFRQIDSFRSLWAEQIVAARAAAPFSDIEGMARAAALPRRALQLLADADALRSIGQDRRAALWEVRRTPSAELPLFAAARARELAAEPDMALPEMPAAEHVAIDYQMTRLSLKAHPMAFLRQTLAADGIVSCTQANAARGGRRLRVAGIVLVRQRPGKGNAIFVTIEDEGGVVNALIWARLFERIRRAVMSARLMVIAGEVQRSREGVVHIIVSDVEDRSALLDTLADGGTPTAPAHADIHVSDPRQHPPRHGHPRDVRILPKSRDFH